MVDFNKHTGHFQICRVCSAVHGSPRYLEKREGGWLGGRLRGGGVYKAERARTVPSLQFGLVRAQSQLASLGLDGRRAGMRRAHACTHQQM